MKQTSFVVVLFVLLLAANAGAQTVFPWASGNNPFPANSHVEHACRLEAGKVYSGAYVRKAKVLGILPNVAGDSVAIIEILESSGAPPVGAISWQPITEGCGQWTPIEGESAGATGTMTATAPVHLDVPIEAWLNPVAYLQAVLARPDVTYPPQVERLREMLRIEQQRVGSPLAGYMLRTINNPY